MGNGVESSVIADDFNEDRIANGVKVSTITEEFTAADFQIKTVTTS